MRIGIDARFLTYPQHGGFKSYTRMVVSALTRVDRENEYILYTDRPSDDINDLPANFSVKPVSGANAVLREQLTLPLRMLRDKNDIVHFLCNTAPVLFGLRMVVTVHDAIALRKNNKFSRNVKQRLLRRYWHMVIPRSVSKARLVLTDSEKAQGDLIETLALTRDKLRVVYLAVDPEFAGEYPGTPPAEIQPGMRFMLAFASADGRKNHLSAIKAYRMARIYPNINLAVICSHPGVHESVEPGSGVVMLGPVLFRELIWLYRNAVALVFPSFDEGFGLPPLEAMTCGTPVVASNTGSLPEVLGDHVIFVDPADVGSIAEGIRLMVRDDALRNRLIIEGRKHASGFSLERMGRELMALYSEACRCPHPNPLP